MKILGLSFLLLASVSIEAMNASQSSQVPNCPLLPKRKTPAQLRADNLEFLKFRYAQDGCDPIDEGIQDFDPATVDLFELVGSGDVERLAQAFQARRSRYGLTQHGYTLRQFAEAMNNGTLEVLDLYQPVRRADLFGDN